MKGLAERVVEYEHVAEMLQRQVVETPVVSGLVMVKLHELRLCLVIFLKLAAVLLVELTTASNLYDATYVKVSSGFGGGAGFVKILHLSFPCLKLN